MSLADRLTASRMVLAPVFFVVYFWGGFMGPGVSSALLVVLFVYIEVSDLLDGHAARSRGTVSAFGKLFDPFADVFARLTYFVCFAYSGIMPLWALLIILYRELAMMFVRMVLAGKGVALGARGGGKLKAFTYMLAGSFSLLLVCMGRLGLFPWLAPAARIATLVLYLCSVALCLGSFVDYLIQFRKLNAERR